MAKLGQTRLNSGILWLVGIAAVVLLVFVIRSFTRDVVQVRVTSVTYQNLSTTIPTNGKVEPVETYQAHTLGPGVIQDVYVHVNQQVTPGTLLFRLNDADAKARLASADALIASARQSVSDIANNGSVEERQRFAQDLATAKAEQQRAQADLAMEQKLLASGAVSQGEVLARQQRLDSANASVRNAQSRMTTRYDAGDRAAQQAHLVDANAARSAAASQLNSTIVRSPIAGTVYYIRYQQYEFVPSGEFDVMDIADLTKVRVKAYFDEPEIGKLAIGQPVLITWPARPDQAWHGHVLIAPTTVQPYGNRSVGECVVSVDDAKGDLLPNTTVTAKVTILERSHVLSIPREALHTEGLSDFVYRLNAGHLQRVPVKVGIVNLTSVEILSGLQDQDVIVLGPVQSGQDLTNGLEVKRVQ